MGIFDRRKKHRAQHIWQHLASVPALGAGSALVLAAAGCAGTIDPINVVKMSASGDFDCPVAGVAVHEVDDVYLVKGCGAFAIYAGDGSLISPIVR